MLVNMDARCGLELQPPGGPAVPQLRLELQPHQRHNVSRFLQCVRYNDGGILIADDLGLGKTCSSLACVEALRVTVKPEYQKFRSLFVVPKSVLDQWRAEMLKFTFVEGKDISINWAKPAARYQLCTYETLRSAFVDSYEKHERDWRLRGPSPHFCFLPDFFRCVVFDEVHRLRNKTAKVHHAARFLGATEREGWITPRIGLSGTPTVNGYADVANVGAVLHFPKRFTEARFFETMNASSGMDFATTVFCKHFKSESLSLPDLITTQHPLEMSEEERTIHRGYVTALNIEVSNFTESKQIAFTDVIVALVRLRQVALHPDLPLATAAAQDTGSDDESDDEYDEDDNVIAKNKKRKRAADAQERAAAARVAIERVAASWERSTKLRWLVERAAFYKSEKRAFLVFTSFSTAAQAVQLILKAHGHKSALFIGSTTDGARRDAIASFQAGSLDALVLTYGAGGTGLHLAPAGSAVVHLDATWTPAAHEQAECRLHRYGTVREVVNDYPLLQGSVDQYIIENVHVKKQAYANALDRVVQHVRSKPVKVNGSSVNMQQVLSLLRWFASMSRQRKYEAKDPATSAAAVAV